MRNLGLTVLIAMTCALSAFSALAQNVDIVVDARKVEDPYPNLWTFFGYDEPNYTYMKDGEKLLTELSALGTEPVHIRVHNLLTTGNGEAAFKWGSTNAYTEDGNGAPRYDWTIVDRIFDTFVARKMKPLVEIGFMPEALSQHPNPYRHTWNPSQPYNTIFTGWSYPPKDYKKWADLVYHWVRHCVERYGESEVASWYWEVWNEPNISYWRGTSEEYFKLYDYSADAVKRALPQIRIGGPTSTGPGYQGATKFLRDFLEHTAHGVNYATGKSGSPLDYITFHAKGAPTVVDGHVRMGSRNQLRDFEEGFKIVASFPEYRKAPIIIGESDPEGCAACSVQYNPQNDYRNGTMYSSYTAETFVRLKQMADKYKVNLRGAVTWAFEFEDQPYFAGFRDLATNGIDKPVLNVFRMFAQLRGNALKTTSSGSLSLEQVTKDGVVAQPDIGAVATRHGRTINVMVWNYHDDNIEAADAAVALQVRSLPRTVKSVICRHYRVDRNHSNSYTLWKRLGAPQQPSQSQLGDLKRAGHLELLTAPQNLGVANGTAPLTFSLPRQGVSLIQLSW